MAASASRQAIPSMSTAQAVTTADFDRVVLEASHQRPVLVDFWAPWCAPCRALGPLLDKLAAEFTGRFTLVKVNTDEEPELASRYGVRGIPNCKLFAGGEVVDEFTGVLPEAQLRDFLAGALPSPAAALVARAQGRLAAGDATGRARRSRRGGRARRRRRGPRADADRSADRRAGERTTRARRRTSWRLRSARARVRCATSGGWRASRRSSRWPAVARQTSTRWRRRPPRRPRTSARSSPTRRRWPRAATTRRRCKRTSPWSQADRAYGDDAGRKGMLTVFEVLGHDSELVRRYRRELAAAINV